MKLTSKQIESFHPSVRDYINRYKKEKKTRRVFAKPAVQVYIEEDATFFAFNCATNQMKLTRASGEWAGMTELMPGSYCPLPVACIMVVSGIRFGQWFMTVYYNSGANNCLQLPTELLYSTPQ